MITCPQCGSSATYILTQGITITACTACAQATVMERNIILRIPRERYTGFEPVKSEFLFIAVVAELLFKNWPTIADRL